MFNRQIALKPLSHVCRSLSTMLESGVSIEKAVKLASTKTRDVRAQAALGKVCTSIRQGNDVASSLRNADDRFPALMIDLVDVGEQTGALPEVLRSLADHYENNVRLRREFVSTIAWPVFQLTAAILVIALLIFVLGIISDTSGGTDVDMLGWGLLGGEGALIWLTMTFGSLGACFAAYQLITRSLRGRQFLDPFLMQIPVLGTCMRSFALARFSWAFALSQQAGMSIEPSLKSSLKATDNGAFIAATPNIWRDVMQGNDLSDALAASELFPEDYLHIVHVAETTGTVPEALERLSPQFEDQARRSLAGLTSVMAWLIWAAVAVFIIYIIFSIFSRYIAMINELLP